MIIDKCDSMCCYIECIATSCKECPKCNTLEFICNAISCGCNVNNTCATCHLDISNVEPILITNKHRILKRITDIKQLLLNININDHHEISVQLATLTLTM